MPSFGLPLIRQLIKVSLATGLLACALGSHAHKAMASADMHGVAVANAASGWQMLTPAQRQSLAPLASQWPDMDESQRQKWLKVASRFDTLSQQERQRIQERMTQWTALPSGERGNARLRFQQARQLPPDERQQKWAAYQALSEEDRRDLNHQAQRRARPVILSDKMVGPREAGQIFAAKRSASTSAPAKKSNTVPNVATGMGGPNGLGAQPVVVAPTLINAGPGATTNLVTRATSSPSHQQSGMSKISVSREFIDPVTLLPRRGAQSAAMASLPAAGSGARQ